jgi:hypothetical protein
MEWIAIFVNGALAVIALWYTIETRRLRLQNQDQLKLLSKQAMLSLVPYVHVSLYNLDTALELYEEEGKLPGSQTEKARFVDKIRRRFSQPGVRFICKISNETTKLATGVRVYVFDCQSKTFFRSEWGRTVLAEKESIELEISQDAVSLEVVTEELRSKYGSAIDPFEQHLITDHTSSYTIVFFRDVGGNAYVVRREFEINIKGIINSKINELILPQD